MIATIIVKRFSLIVLLLQTPSFFLINLYIAKIKNIIPRIIKKNLYFVNSNANPMLPNPNATIKIGVVQQREPKKPAPIPAPSDSLFIILTITIF